MSEFHMPMSRWCGYANERIEELEDEVARLKDIIKRWEPLIEEHDQLADLLADWTMAADRHGVPDELERLPEAAFDYVAEHRDA